MNMGYSDLQGIVLNAGTILKFRHMLPASFFGRWPPAAGHESFTHVFWHRRGYFDRRLVL
jgi:hypothetical protein